MRSTDRTLVGGGLLIGWHGAGGRAPALAAALDIDDEYFDIPGRGSVLRATGRYVRMALNTVSVLRTRRPEMVIVTNPPIFAALTVYLVQRVIGGRLIIDSHTGAFVDRRWRHFLFLHRYLSRRAALTIVHNSVQARIVDGWGVEWLQLGYVPMELPAPEPSSTDQAGRPMVFAVCAGAADEPLDAIAEAGRALPDIDIVITGKADRVRAQMTKSLPSNVQLLGYVDFADYLRRLQSADAVMALTTRNATLVNGGFEAIAARRPLITSDSEVLRDYFHRGTMYTGSTAPEIASAIGRCLADRQQLEAEMGALAGEYQQIWERARPEVLGRGST